jgi:hypothetical protein
MQKHKLTRFSIAHPRVDAGVASLLKHGQVVSLPTSLQRLEGSWQPFPIGGVIYWKIPPPRDVSRCHLREKTFKEGREKGGNVKEKDK